MNIISKPSKENIKSYLPIGITLVLLSILDVFVNAFFNYNLLGFFPSQISYFSPLIFGFIGFYLIRIEFSGIRSLDILNKNINSTNFNAFLTLLTLFILIKFIPPLLNWFILDANFLGNTKDDCTGDGACWVFIKVWFNRFMYGLYPDAEQWRINTAFLILFAVVGVSFFVKEKLKKYFILFLIFIYPFLGIELISGGNFGLKYVETAAWGGLSLTFIISAFAILFCFPIGVFLALGRRSSLPAIRYISIGFIELWRGVPLITVLFMSAVMFPMFLPDGTFIDKLIRVLIAINIIWIILCILAYNVKTPSQFYSIAGLVGMVMGGLQSLSRSTYSKLLPKTLDTTSFFSFYDVTEKIGIVIGMLCFGLIDQISGSMRNGILFFIAFFFLGALMLARIPKK